MTFNELHAELLKQGEKTKRLYDYKPSYGAINSNLVRLKNVKLKHKKITGKPSKANPFIPSSPHFNINRDEIVMPLPMQYKDDEGYYRNLFHELVHSTGPKVGRFSSGFNLMFHFKDYAKEELTAEIGSIILCRQFGFVRHETNSLNYLRHWKTKTFKEAGCKALGKQSLQECYNKATEAVDYIMANNIEGR